MARDRFALDRPILGRGGRFGRFFSIEGSRKSPSSKWHEGYEHIRIEWENSVRRVRTLDRRYLSQGSGWHVGFILGDDDLSQNNGSVSL